MSEPSGARRFIASAATRYLADNRATLEWMLDRAASPARRASPFVDTKVNPLTLEDYTAADALRGPGFVYGWIQGRALEALCTHAAFLESRDAALAARLDAQAVRLHAALESSLPRSGEVPFCRDAAGRALRTDAARAGERQRREPGIRTYADVFVTKGLIASSARHRPASLARHLDTLADIVAAIGERRFLTDERGDVDAAALARQGDAYDPRMILLGASALLRRFGLDTRDDFSERFLEHVLARHLEPRSGLLADEPGGERCNVGHGIELVGLAFQTLRARLPADTVGQLCDILIAHARAGSVAPGIALTVDARRGVPTSPYRPWWSLPETVRAAALAYEASGRAELLALWMRADTDYFAYYRRTALPVAYQTLTATGPVDHVPATPDLDPGYHTGLSLLAAVEMHARRTVERDGDGVDVPSGCDGPEDRSGARTRHAASTGDGRTGHEGPWPA